MQAKELLHLDFNDSTQLGAQRLSTGLEIRLHRSLPGKNTWTHLVGVWDGTDLRDSLCISVFTPNYPEAGQLCRGKLDLDFQVARHGACPGRWS